MKKIILCAMVLSGVLFGADFSKSSNDDLIKLAGKVDPKDVPSYYAEIEKRVDDMTMKQAREFKDQIREQERQVYDNMKVKDFKARQRAIRDAMRAEFKGKKCHKHFCGKSKMDRPILKGDDGDRGFAPGTSPAMPLTK